MIACLNSIEDALTYYLMQKGSHSSSILRLYYIDREDGQENCVREVMNLLRSAVEFSAAHEELIMESPTITNGSSTSH